MVRRNRAEIHVNQERWLVSYADFITLLFAFFVVMYSISQVNESKYRVLSDTLVHAFKSPTEFSTDNNPEHSGTPSDTTLNPIQVGKPALTPASSAIDVRSENVGQVPQEFSEISELFAERFGDLIDDKLISVSSNELWLQIELKDSILFTSGNADPSPQAQVIFDEIAQILKDYPNPVQVEGYTDNIPINSARYPSNWELSSARASAIVKLLASKDIAPQRLSAVGFGEFQPIADNASQEGRAQNRRVALMIAQKALSRPGAKLGETVVSQEVNSARELFTDTGLPEPATITPEPENELSRTSEEPEPSADTLPAAPLPSVQLENQLPEQALTPVELDDGGLLFTSDPELQRNP